MLKSFLVPDTAGVEHEDLLGLLAAENQVGVEGVGVPHEGGGHTISFYFLQVVNVHVDAFHISEQTGLVEDDLLGMGQKLSVESEETKGGHLAGSGEQGNEQGENQELAHTSDEAEERAGNEVVRHADSHEVFSLV